jgi:Holliday junction resolvase RusA-like endonuclease
VLVNRTVTIDVRGLPRPQGSLHLHPLPNGNVAARYPSGVYAWRAQVQQAVAEFGSPPFPGPVELRLGFELPRPLKHISAAKVGHPAHGTVVASAPAWPAVYPDLDKLCRCVMDACTDAGLWGDDKQVCLLEAGKAYTVRHPGVIITVTDIGGELL